MTTPTITLADAPPELSLRAAQKELTRRRIRDAAKTVFYTVGYAATTMEQITAASGVSRATIYVHFKDKEEIVLDIVADFTGRGESWLRKLPGPDPSLQEIRSWLDGMVQFYDQERVSIPLLYQVVKQGSSLSTYVKHMTGGSIAILAEKLPAFGLALRDDVASLETRVRADLVMQQISWACEHAARDGASAYNAMMLDLTAQAFRQFVDDQNASNRGASD
jgi:AcrR family transcriptional regulator